MQRMWLHYAAQSQVEECRVSNWQMVEMFDFADEQTSEYQNFVRYVDVGTNTPYPVDFLKQNLQALEYNYTPNYDALQFMAIEKEGLLTHEECQFLIEETLEQNKWIELKDFPFWSNRNTGLFSLVDINNKDKIIGGLVIKVHDSIRNLVSQHFVNGDTVYCDQIGIVRWPVGSWQMTHIDQVEGLKRVCGSVLYLNDSYDGGHTFYPFFDKHMTPKTGKFFAHSPDNDHLHGVTKIIGQTRYTISSTWGTNPDYDVYAKQISAIREYL
jgi:hypothetical protein